MENSKHVVSLRLEINTIEVDILITVCERNVPVKKDLRTIYGKKKNQVLIKVSNFITFENFNYQKYIFVSIHVRSRMYYDRYQIQTWF